MNILYIIYLLISTIIIFTTLYCILYFIFGSTINNNIYGVIITLFISYYIIYYLNIHNYTFVLHILFISSIIFSIFCYLIVNALKNIG